MQDWRHWYQFQVQNPQKKVFYLLCHHHLLKLLSGKIICILPFLFASVNCSPLFQSTNEDYGYGTTSGDYTYKTTTGDYAMRSLDNEFTNTTGDYEYGSTTGEWSMVFATQLILDQWAPVALAASVLQ